MIYKHGQITQKTGHNGFSFLSDADKNAHTWRKYRKVNEIFFLIACKFAPKGVLTPCVRRKVCQRKCLAAQVWERERERESKDVNANEDVISIISQSLDQSTKNAHQNNGQNLSH